MLKRALLALLLFASLARPACDLVTLPLDWTSAAGISRANLNLNPIALRDAHNDCADTLNTLLAALTGYATALTLSSNEDLILKVDADANGTHKMVVTANSLDSMLRIHEDGTARFFDHLVVDSNLTVRKVTAADSLIGPSATLSGLTASLPVFTNGGKTLTSNAMTGTGNVMMSASPTTTGTLNGAAANFSGAVSTGALSATTAAISGDITYSGADTKIIANTSDGADSKVAKLTGGGDALFTRGGFAAVYGNESSAPGDVELAAGTVTGGSINFYTASGLVYTVGQDQIHAFSTLINAAGGVEISGGTSAAGRINKSATGGLVIRGVAGSSYDMIISTPSGSDILYNPTGTTQVQFPGAGGVSVTGDATMSGLLHLNNALPEVRLTDAGGGDVYSIRNDAGDFAIRNNTGSNNTIRLLNGGNSIQLNGPVAASSTLGVTGKVTAGDLAISSFSTQYTIPFATNTSGDMGASSSLTFNSSTNTLGTQNGTLSGTLGVTGVATFTAAPVFSSVTASQFLLVDGSKALTSVAGTGSGSVVRATSPTITTPTFSGTIASGLTASRTVITDGSGNLAVNTETGTGSHVRATSPTLVTPTLGVASATTIALGGNEAFDYDEGSFTASLSGTGGTTTTARYTRVGKMVVLHFVGATGTSSTSTLVISGIPAGIRPARVQTVIGLFMDNGNWRRGSMDIQTDGTAEAFLYDETTPGPQNFTASGTKGIDNLAVTYNLL